MTSGNPLVQCLLLKTGPTWLLRAVCTLALISPGMETPQPLWAVLVFSHPHIKFIFFLKCFCYMPVCWKGKGWCALPSTCFECVRCWKSCSQRCLNLCSLQGRRNLNKWLFSALFDLSANVFQLKQISLPNWVNLTACWMSLKVDHENKTSQICLCPLLGVCRGGNCSTGVHGLSNNAHYSEVWKTL